MTLEQSEGASATKGLRVINSIDLCVLKSDILDYN